jgi:hypothetical protein
MIKYALACESAHRFESWFASSDAFETQRRRGLVTCPVCNSPKVDKQVMAPSVARTEKADAAERSDDPAPGALLSARERQARAMVRAFREQVTRNAENVGERFPDEVRRMHYGDIEHRSIYGQASPVEARSLAEEGVEVYPLPVLLDDCN